MKVTTESNFNPFNLVIKVESPQEAIELFCMFNMPPINTVAKSVEASGIREAIKVGMGKVPDYFETYGNMCRCLK